MEPVAPQEEELNLLPLQAISLMSNSIFYPMVFAKTLIEIGFEPVLPTPTTNYFNSPRLSLPSIFSYIRHIKRVDGLTGCYRGMSVKICENAVQMLVAHKVYKMTKVKNRPDDELPSTQEFLYKLGNDLLVRTSSVIVSYPLRVIAIRMMAQFVGRETQYGSLFSSIAEIYRHHGLFGFFRGLMPRLIGEFIAIALGSTVTYLVRKYVLNERYRDKGELVRIVMLLLSDGVAHPFRVVSNSMAVTDSGLAAGSPPHMPHYESWTDCWGHLRETNQLQRGACVLSRYYTKPIKIQPSDRLVPLLFESFPSSK